MSDPHRPLERGACKDCRRPLNEEEIELNGAICNDCDHYRREIAKEPPLAEGALDDQA